MNEILAIRFTTPNNQSKRNHYIILDTSSGVTSSSLLVWTQTYCNEYFVLECEEPYFGENCSRICTCGQGMDRCDSVTGCVCRQGWGGFNCTDDINECAENQDVCGFLKNCKNLEGSYQCDCKEGYQLNEDICEGNI